MKKFILTVLFIFAHITLQARENSSPQFPEIADYYTLLKLSETDRQTYIEGVITIMNELEKSGLYVPAESLASEENDLAHNSFMQWLAVIRGTDAEAQQAGRPNVRVVYGPGAAANSGLKCETKACPDGYAFTQKGNGQLCESLSCSILTNREKLIRTCTYSADGCIETCKCELPSSRSANPKPQNPPIEGSTMDGLMPLPSTNTEGQSLKPNQRATEQDSETENANNTGPVNPNETTRGLGPKNPNQVNPNLTPKQDNGNRRGDRPQDDERSKPRSAGADKKDSQCLELKCPSDDRHYRFNVKEAFNARVSSRNDVRCINGGLIGKYSIKTRKKCEPIQNFTIGKLKLKCSATQTMCNPLLFGLAKETPPTAHCIPIGLEITEACKKKSSPDDARKFWKHPDLTHEEIAQAWRQLTDHFMKDICSEKASAEYHCKECALIGQRIRELNKKAADCMKRDCGNSINCLNSSSPILQIEKTDTQKGGTK